MSRAQYFSAMDSWSFALFFGALDGLGETSGGLVGHPAWAVRGGGKASRVAVRGGGKASRVCGARGGGDARKEGSGVYE